MRESNSVSSLAWLTSARLRSLVLGSAVVAAVWLMPSQCRAQAASPAAEDSPAADADARRLEARRLAGIAFDLYAAGDFARALEKFEAASKQFAAPTIDLQIARCLDKLDRLQESVKAYRRVIDTELTADSNAAFVSARASAVDELAKLLPQIPKLRVVVVGATTGAIVKRIDGVEESAAAVTEGTSLDPGTHEIEVQHSRGVQRMSVRLARSADESVRVQIPVAAEQGGDGLAIAGWTVLGVGAAGMITGAVFGGLALERESSLIDQCGSARSCPPSAQDAVDEYDTQRLIASIGLYGGGALAALGTTLLIVSAVTGDEDADALADDSAALSAPTLSLRVHPFGASLQGTF